MKFSIIMPSYLAPYAGSARNKEGKFLRAIYSVLNQTFTNFELHVIADGCDETEKIVKDNITDPRVKLHRVVHQKLWSGRPRNKGIEESQGEYIVYLDIDDIYGTKHLEIIDKNLGSFDWVWYNDITFNTKDNNWYERQCNIKVISQHGTSNICHKREMNMFWDEEGRYAHDYYFIQKFLSFPNFTKIETPEYYVCHIPGGAGGYDL